ncbi:beta-galactosidase [Vibrio tritonius]|uniref:beta-galactosidase n=1 Tax=Vibrio tritonius TaxID=1435069 RepID=UPI00315D9152
MSQFSSVIPNVHSFLHGADYNPEQWLDRSDILEQDIQLMKQTHCNVMSVGIFSWAALEPKEGEFHFEWLDGVLDRFAQNGISAFLATPSGARPAWLSQRYPDVLRVDKNRVKQLHGERHNHCYNSPNYLTKVGIINRKLAERYSHHPAVIGWHISNEYGGECHCETCQSHFREWLKARYGTLDNLNQQWWTAFWSHTFSDWSQIESPSPKGENSLHGLNLDWKRFRTDCVVAFCQHEIEPLKARNPDLPVITNFMEYFYDYDYWKLKDVIDVVSWDNYPLWHRDADELELASYTAMYHDLMRTMKQQPFLLMESTPSQTNWQPITKLKKNGMHILSSLQAVAHGSDSVQYFQWRKSRGSVEKFHGAVIDHVGHADTRTGREVTKLGEQLAAISDVCGGRTQSQVAIVFDWDSRWAMDDASGPRNQGLYYEQVVSEHYRGFWELGINCDIIEQLSDFTPYKVVVAPMLYLIKPGVAERLESFVKSGGVLVATYWTGIVNETDLCFLGGFPGGSDSPLRRTFGIWAEEIDSLYDDERVDCQTITGNVLNLQADYKAKHLCEHLHLETAQAVANYQSDLFAATPCLTVNPHGQGSAYYVAARHDVEFYRAFYRQLVLTHHIAKPLDEVPLGISITTREQGNKAYLFIMNFLNSAQNVELNKQAYYNLINKHSITDGVLKLNPYEVAVLTKDEM